MYPFFQHLHILCTCATVFSGLAFNHRPSWIQPFPCLVLILLLSERVAVCPLKGGANERYVPHLNLRPNLQLSVQKQGHPAQLFLTLIFFWHNCSELEPTTQVISCVGPSTRRFHFWLEDRVNVKGRLACIFAWWFNQAAAVMAVVKCLPEGRSGARA